MTHAISVRGLVKKFKSDQITFNGWGKSPLSKDKIALDQINFDVELGKATGFVGANGAGKTTSLKIILNFIYPDSGEVLFFNQQQLCSEIKAQIGYLPERPYFYEFLTATEFLKFHWDLLGSPKKDFAQRAQEVLRQVDLYEARNQRLRSFSKGMLQRVGIAQSILNRPKLLILDEPMSGLDPDGRVMIKSIMHQQIKEGVTLFFSSHLLQDMEELCDNIIMIEQGKLLYSGALESLIHKKQQKVELFYKEKQTQLILKDKVTQEALQEKIDELRKEGIEILRIQPESVSLESAFVDLRHRVEVDL